jgi:hypothetical protein
MLCGDITWEQLIGGVFTSKEAIEDKMLDQVQRAADLEKRKEGHKTLKEKGKVREDGGT